MGDWPPVPARTIATLALVLAGVGPGLAAPALARPMSPHSLPHPAAGDHDPDDPDDDSGHSGDDREVERRGACSRGAEWKLKVKEDDGRLEVEIEVDSDRPWQLWRWRMLHDGYVSARGSATTTSRSGSFEVERRMTDNSGADVVALRVRNPATRELCVGSLTW